MKSCASSSRGTYWERRGDMSETESAHIAHRSFGVDPLEPPEGAQQLDPRHGAQYSRARWTSLDWTLASTPFW